MSNDPNPNVRVETSYLSDAWEILKNKAGFIILYSLIVMGISYVFNLLWEVVYPMQPETPPTTMEEVMQNLGPTLAVSFVTGLLNQVITSAFMAGLILYCIKELRTRNAQFTDIFDGFNFFFSAFAVVLITSIASFVGLLGCIVGAFVTTGLCMLALPLVVDRKLGPWEAITTSWRVLGSQWGNTTLYYFLAFLIAMSGILLCGIGVIWTSPFVAIASAALYTRLYDTPTVSNEYSPYVRDVQLGDMPEPPKEGEQQRWDEPPKPPEQ